MLNKIHKAKQMKAARKAVLYAGASFERKSWGATTCPTQKAIYIIEDAVAFFVYPAKLLVTKDMVSVPTMPWVCTT